MLSDMIHWQAWAVITARRLRHRVNYYRLPAWNRWCITRARILSRKGRTGKLSDSHKPSKKNILKLVERQGKTCALTGLSLTPDTASLDHRHPVSNGGSDSVANLQVLHDVVNQMKGTLSQAEFISWCQTVADYSRQDDG